MRPHESTDWVAVRGGRSGDVTPRIAAADLARLLGSSKVRRASSGCLRLNETDARALGLSFNACTNTKPFVQSKRAVAAKQLDPQTILTRALRERLGVDAVASEVVGLIEGRRYRADIVLHKARLVIEFDGFQYHRSKSAFQKDRERQNVFVQHGWRVLRFFNKQVHADLDAVVEQIVACAS